MGPLAAVDRGARRARAGRHPGGHPLAGFLAAWDITSLAQADRGLLERYLGDLHREFAGRDIQGKQTGQLAAFPRRYPPSWLTLAFNCVARDSQGAPYLRSTTRK